MAVQLEQLLQNWPVTVETLTIVGHSMGGLLARSAVHQATQDGMRWPQRLRSLVFLGTPHHGAPLERGGNWLHRGLGISPYAAPFTRLSGLRSAGITDLRHGNLLEEDWADNRFALRDERSALPLPAGVACYAVAGTLGPLPEGQEEPVLRSGRGLAARLLPNEWLGDGLVPVASALGRHPKPTRDLHIPPSHTWVGRGIHHLDLLASERVYQLLRQWLAH
jgi:pimeloyl-ACP methyl ester carboxylesterase